MSRERVAGGAQVVADREDGPVEDVTVGVLLTALGERGEEVEGLRPVTAGVLVAQDRSSTSRCSSSRPSAVSSPTGPWQTSRVPQAPPENCSRPRGER